MAISLDAQLDAQAWLDAFDTIVSSFEDLEPLFDEIVEDFVIPSIKNIFDTDGLDTWAASSWSLTLLRDTYNLYNSLTDLGHSENVYDPDEKSFLFDSNVEYFHFHELGSVDVPARPILGLVDPEDPAVSRIVSSWAENIVSQALASVR